MKPSNQYFLKENYIIGITKSGDKFLFDAENYNLVIRHRWYTHTSHGNKYVMTKINNKTIFLHRLVLGYPNNDVDHKDHNGMDCRKQNLRICSRSNNMGNRRKKKGATSKYKGVYFYNKDKKWKAQIQFKGKKISLGTYINEVDAAAAYNKAAAIYFGEYANLNIV